MDTNTKWLADGSVVVVLDAGHGVPGDGDYAPALVARLATEYHEPAQVLDQDPLEQKRADEQAAAAAMPGEQRGGAAGLLAGLAALSDHERESLRRFFDRPDAPADGERDTPAPTPALDPTDATAFGNVPAGETAAGSDEGDASSHDTPAP